MPIIRSLTLVCILAALLLGIAFAGDDAPAASDAPHIVFIIAEREYNTRETLPAFAERHLAPDNFRTTFVEPTADDGNDFPGLIEAVADADLLVLSVRRRALPEAQLRAVREYLEAGGPLVGIRTSSHAFDPHDLPKGAAAWRTFDRDVLGAHYQGHYANHGEDGPATVVQPADAGATEHPILADWPDEAIQSTSHLYRNRDLAEGVTVLLTGHVQGEADDTTEPLAWTHTYRGGRIFYTSLGSVDDFALEPFQHMLRDAVHWAGDF